MIDKQSLKLWFHFSWNNCYEWRWKY